MSEFIVAEVVDLPPNREASESRTATCEICGKTWESRAKVLPTRCSDHKATKVDAKVTPNDALLKSAVADMYRAISLIVMPFDQFDAMAIANGADRLADSWMELAKTDPKVKKFLSKMTQTSSWGAVIVAHSMVAMPILQHHKLLPGAKEPGGN